MRPQPYIGVTGFMSEADVREVLFVVPKDARHKLMVGVLASQKTFRGEQNKYPNRYPSKDVIGSIFVEHPQALNLVHYHTLVSDQMLASELMAVRHAAEPHCHGFQLNVRWPSPKALEIYHHASSIGFRPKQDVVVLQCGRSAMADVDFVPEKLAQRVTDYKGLVDYVLIDPSGGKGQGFDRRFAYECMCELTKFVPDMGLGVAGGLAAEMVGSIEDLLKTHPDISIDAEGRLRKPDDSLKVGAANHYVVAANRLFRRYPVAA
jgi:hypothetical protein